MIKIGITGGIGSGKSVVARLMHMMKIPVYNADDASKNILQTDASVKNRLQQLLGEDIYKEDLLDRKKMASLIFNDRKLLSQTNVIIHPAVLEDFERWSSKQQTEIVGCESAIIFESGFNDLMDYVITVVAPVTVRIDRAVKRDGMSAEEVTSRIKNQMAEEEKSALSHFVINNDNEDAIIPQLNRIIGEIKKENSQCKR